jgi:hypothetical protein
MSEQEIWLCIIAVNNFFSGVFIGWVFRDIRRQ